MQDDDLILQKGISSHLHNLYNSTLTNSQAPNQLIVINLQSLRSIVKQRKQSLQKILSLKHKLSLSLTNEDVTSLIEFKQRKQSNQQVLTLITIIRQIETRINSYSDTQGTFKQRMQHKDTIFKQIYGLIAGFEDQVINIVNSHCLSPQQVPTDTSFSNELQGLKHMYLCKLRSTLKQSIIQAFYSQYESKLQSALIYCELPRRVKSDQKEPELLQQQHRQVIVESLFTEYCYYCLCKKIELVLEQSQAMLSCEAGPGPSLFFNKLWQSINKAINYIFLQPALHTENNTYQIDQPGWMFEYLQKSFNINYSYINRIMLNGSRNPIDHNILEQTQTYFVSYNMRHFFMRNLVKRLNCDVKLLNLLQESEETSNNNKKTSTPRPQSQGKVSFIIFNFLDELSTLEQQLSVRYNYEMGFVQEILNWAENQQTLNLNLLEYCFDYEHEWIEQRIFSEFYVINYSEIKDLRNIEAYNIVVNFIQLFEKLYIKFKKIKSQLIRDRVHGFYHQEILRLIRHVKSSFERIYKNSGLQKYDIVLGFKKVEDEFRGYFTGFIKGSPQFEQLIQSEYYSFLDGYAEATIIEQLTPVHKKIYRRLTQFEEMFAKGRRVESHMAKWDKIYTEWSSKMGKVSKVKQYTDIKLKNIFYVYLETGHFNRDGCAIFMELFEPFLSHFYSIDRIRTLRMLIEMEKGTLKEYCQSHRSLLVFLNENELKSIQLAQIK